MTVKLKLGEALVDALVAKLKTGLSARIDTINADYDDQVTLAAPADSSYYTSGIESIPAAPAVIVAEGAMRPNRNAEAVHSFITTTQLLVWVLDQDANRQLLGKRLQRLARAVIETAWDDAPQEQLAAVAPWAGNAPAAWRITPLSTTPGRVFEPTQPDSLRGFYLIVFAAEAVEG